MLHTTAKQNPFQAAECLVVCTIPLFTQISDFLTTIITAGPGKKEISDHVKVTQGRDLQNNTSQILPNYVNRFFPVLYNSLFTIPSLVFRLKDLKIKLQNSDSFIAQLSKMKNKEFKHKVVSGLHFL